MGSLSTWWSASPTFTAWWRVRDSNPRRLSRLIYSQIPLAAWVTRHALPTGVFTNRVRGIQDIGI